MAEIEAGQALVAANREPIERMEKKIQAVLARVWGDERPDPAPAAAQSAPKRAKRRRLASQPA